MLFIHFCFYPFAMTFRSHDYVQKWKLNVTRSKDDLSLKMQNFQTSRLFRSIPHIQSTFSHKDIAKALTMKVIEDKNTIYFEGLNQLIWEYDQNSAPLFYATIRKTKQCLWKEVSWEWSCESLPHFYKILNSHSQCKQLSW